jgi:hypothetical protein
MGVAVYPRLSELLHQRSLTVAELGRQIERRFGLAVDPKTLYRLANVAPIQRADLEIAGAVATLLDVGLDDLFDVRVVPDTEGTDSESNVVSSTQSQRLSELFDRQARGALLPTEAAELEASVAAYGRQLHARRLRELAEQRGISIEEAGRVAEGEFDRAREWWQTFEADPERRQTVIGRVKKRGRSSLR